MDLNRRLEAIANEAIFLQDENDESSALSNSEGSISEGSSHLIEPSNSSNDIETPVPSNVKDTSVPVDSRAPAIIPLFYIESSSEIETSPLATNVESTLYCAIINRFLALMGLESATPVLPILPIYQPRQEPNPYTVSSILGRIQLCLIPSLVSNIMVGNGLKVVYLILLILLVYGVLYYINVGFVTRFVKYILCIFLYGSDPDSVCVAAKNLL